MINIFANSILWLKFYKHTRVLKTKSNTNFYHLNEKPKLSFFLVWITFIELMKKKLANFIFFLHFFTTIHICIWFWIIIKLHLQLRFWTGPKIWHFERFWLMPGARNLLYIFILIFLYLYIYIHKVYICNWVSWLWFQFLDIMLIYQRW